MTLIYQKARLVREIDQNKTGASFAKERVEAGITQRTMAKALGLTASNLCQLEKVMQRRKWTEKTAERYEAALKGLTKS